MKDIFSNDKAQAGTIAFILIGLFVLGIFLVIFGYVMNGVETANTDIVNNPSIHNSKNHYDVMQTIFDYWWAVPIYAIILFAIYGIKKALDKQAGSAY